MERRSSDQPERLFTVGHVAELLGISDRTVYRKIASQELVAVSIGRCRRIPNSAYEAYLKSLMRQSGR